MTESLKATEVVLFRPQIPPNTGTIARTCAATASPLHLIEPLGFSIDNRWVRRAGLDYWPHVQLHCWPSLDALFAARPHAGRWFISKSGALRYDRVAYRPGDLLIFGSEIDGLPPDVLEANRDRTVYIPMVCPAVRSLNLANAANIILYESRRQTGLLD